MSLPIPLYLDAVERFGTPVTSLSDGRVRFVDPAWPRLNIQVTPLAGGFVTWLHKDIREEAAALFSAAAIADAPVSAVRGFVPRHTQWSPHLPVSLHTWGIALDVILHQGTLRDYPAFVRVFKDAGWSWGGDRLVPEDCHLQRAI